MAGQRSNKGKPKLSLIPYKPLCEIAKVLEFGVVKYDRNNWRKGLSFNECIDSIERHLGEWKEGEDNDKESGLSHIAHVAVNALFLLEFLKTHPELDDRYKK